MFCTVVINLHNLPYCTLTHIHTHTQHNQCCHWPVVYLDFMHVTGTSIVPNKTSENRGVFFFCSCLKISEFKNALCNSRKCIYIILIHDSYYNVHFINLFFFYHSSLFKSIRIRRMVIQEVWYANIYFFLGQDNKKVSEIILKLRHF